MTTTQSGANDGVEATTGFAFQRNSALFIILDNPQLVEQSDFFICIEHHDDLIFGYKSKNGSIEKVDAYQVKKKSTGDWSATQELGEILAKMTCVGYALRNDDHIKSDDYSQNLIFLSNANTKLNCGKRKPPRHSVVVRESNLYVRFQDLHESIKNNVITKFGDNKHYPEEIGSLEFKFLDMPKTNKAQKHELLGMLVSTYGDTISDHAAALVVLLALFHDAETIYNQGNVSRLMDEKKRIHSDTIVKALDVITTKAKAFKVWRENANSLKKTLEIPLIHSELYKEHIDNCFDYFKDLEQVEYQKIFNFVNETRDVDEAALDHAECFLELRNRYLADHQSQLSTYAISFAIIAAYFETRKKLI